MPLTSNEWMGEVWNERTRQQSIGYDHHHDAIHGMDHLLMWAQEYGRRGESVKAAALVEAARELLSAKGAVETHVYMNDGRNG